VPHYSTSGRTYLDKIFPDRCIVVALLKIEYPKQSPNPQDFMESVLSKRQIWKEKSVLFVRQEFFLNIFKSEKCYFQKHSLLFENNI
jgi:hypothetical protein